MASEKSYIIEGLFHIKKNRTCDLLKQIRSCFGIILQHVYPVWIQYHMLFGLPRSIWDTSEPFNGKRHPLCDKNIPPVKKDPRGWINGAQEDCALWLMN